jgi:hypothetical protein
MYVPHSVLNVTPSHVPGIGSVLTSVVDSEDDVASGEVVGELVDVLVDVLVAEPDEVAPGPHVCEGTCSPSLAVLSDPPDSVPSPASERAPQPSTMATLHNHRHRICIIKTGSMPRMTRLVGRAKRMARIA